MNSRHIHTARHSLGEDSLSLSLSVASWAYTAVFENMTTQGAFGGQDRKCSA